MNGPYADPKTLLIELNAPRAAPAITGIAQAAATMSADPAALQLRLLQTVAEVAAEKNSTLVMPFPVELLRFLERATDHTVHDLKPGLPVPPDADEVHEVARLG